MQKRHLGNRVLMPCLPEKDGVKLLHPLVSLLLALEGGAEMGDKLVLGLLPISATNLAMMGISSDSLNSVCSKDLMPRSTPTEAEALFIRGRSDLSNPMLWQHKASRLCFLQVLGGTIVKIMTAVSNARKGGSE